MYKQPNYKLGVYTTFYEGTHLVEKGDNGIAYSVLGPAPVLAELDPTIEAFTDSSIKFIFHNTYVYGHVVTGWMYHLLKEYEANKDSGVGFTVLLTHHPEEPAMVLNHMSSFTEYLRQRLLDKGIKVEYITSPRFYATNFVAMSPEGVNIRHTWLKNVADFFSEDLDYSTPPTKKVYLSRGKTTTFNGNQGYDLDADTIADDTAKIHEIRNTHTYKFSSRIDDEKKLEDYLMTLGFEIMYPEDYSSYRDQLQILASSKTVMSITSSSLAACYVMAPHTNLIEVASPITPVINPDSTADLEYLDFPDHYKAVASVNGSFYAAIPARSKKTGDVIAAIESNSALKALLTS